MFVYNVISTNCCYSTYTGRITCIIFVRLRNIKYLQEITYSWFFDTAISGELIGKLILNLHKHQHIPFDQFHIIGHSLGAHAAGVAGKYVKSKTGHKIGRITGLDVAGPFFEFPRTLKADNHHRLTKDDAKTVECLHTDAGLAGYISAIGTIDFYANGGNFLQPNCTEIQPITSLKDLQFKSKNS